MQPSKTVCIFAGARGNAELYPDNEWIAKKLVESGWQIIYGGSSRGVMGAVCKAVKEAGGKITGVLPERVHALGHYDKDIETLVAKTMAERKQLFWDRSDAFLCLPGSYGSMDELFEVLTLMKLGYMPVKPVVVFNQTIKTKRHASVEGLAGFYDGLERLLQDMTEQGFMGSSIDGSDRSKLVKFCPFSAMVIEAINGK